MDWVVDKEKERERDEERESVCAYEREKRRCTAGRRSVASSTVKRWKSIQAFSQNSVILVDQNRKGWSVRSGGAARTAVGECDI